jgi:hypothetical protein
MADEGRTRRRRRRGRAPEAGATPEARLQAEADHLVRQLCALAAKVARRRGPHVRGELTVTLRAPLGSPPAPDAGRRLVDDLAAEVDRALAVHAEFQPGRVYCFQCGDARCAHTAPATATQTFAGYTPLGKPEWREFLELCLERRPPGLDGLYADPPAVLALVLAGDELTGGLLPGFGRGSVTCTVLGQVTAGLVRVGDERIALTLQVVETRPGPERLRLNVIGLSPVDIAAAASEAAPRSPAERLRRTIDETRHRLAGLTRRAAVAESRREPWDMVEQLRPLLSRLRSDLERIFRPEPHRTRHARERHLNGERPTSSALDDARRASDDRLLVDTHQDTIVVLGPHNRTHVFSRHGRHVTSLKLEPGELTRKMARRRWRELPADQAAAFRRALAAVSRPPRQNLQ